MKQNALVADVKFLRQENERLKGKLRESMEKVNEQE